MLGGSCSSTQPKSPLAAQSKLDALPTMHVRRIASLQHIQQLFAEADAELPCQNDGPEGPEQLKAAGEACADGGAGAGGGPAPEGGGGSSAQVPTSRQQQEQAGQHDGQPTYLRRLSQHEGLQPPGPVQQAGVQRQTSLGPQHHSLGLLDRKALGTLTRLQVGLPARGGSKTFSSSSGLSYGSQGDLAALEAGGGGSTFAGAASPRPTLPYGEPVARLLERRCGKARDMLARLQAPVITAAGEKPPLPSAALRFCKGLAFVKQRKAGAVLGWNWGDVLLIQRLPDGSWSAPCFLRLRFASLGLTLGAQSMRSVLVLQSRRQIAELTHAFWSTAVDATVPVDFDPFDQTNGKAIKHTDLALPPDAEKPHRAMFTGGLIYDLSFRAGARFVDDGLHAQLYGPGATPEDILSGRQAPPPELLPLYEDLEERAAGAQVVRRTVSKFEVARTQSLKQKGSFRKARRALQKQSSVSTPSQHTDGGAGGSAGPTSASSSLQAGGNDALAHSLSGLNGFLRSSPQAEAAPGGRSPSSPSLKLFGDVDIGFVQLHSCEEDWVAEEELQGPERAGAEVGAQAGELQATPVEEHAPPPAAPADSHAAQGGGETTLSGAAAGGDCARMAAGATGDGPATPLLSAAQLKLEAPG